MTSNLLISKPAIPKQAIRVTSKNTYDADCMLRNVRRGLRHNFAKLATAATQEYVQYDLGVGNTAAADHLIIARADMLQSDGVTKVTLTGSSASITQPLEVTTQPTVFWDFSDDSQITMDSLRRISAVANKGSVTAATLAQTTDGYKFVKTRRDNRENRFLNSQIFAGWSKNQVSITDDAAAEPLTGTSTAATVMETATTDGHYIYQTGPQANGETVRLSIYAKANGRNYLYAWLNNNAGGAYYNLSTGAVQGTPTSGYTATIEAVGTGAGWYRCTLTAAATATGSYHGGFAISDTGSRYSYAGDVTKGLYVWGAQFANSSADATYTATTDQRAFRGVNGHSVAHADGSDDVMTSTATLADVCAAGAKTIVVIGRSSLGAVAGNQYLFADSGSKTVLYRLTSTATIRFYNNDGSPDTVDKTLTANAVFVAICRQDSGTIKMALNNGAEGTASSGDTSALTGTLMVGGGASSPALVDLCAVLVWNVALSDADCLSLYNWAASRFIATPTYQTFSFNTATLYGPDGSDFITTFSTTSAYRYWWLEYGFADGGTTTSTFPRSKEYLGTFFDIGSHPNGFEYKRTIPQTGKIEYPLGNRFLCQSADPLYELEIDWRGVSDANAKLFLQLMDEPRRDMLFLYAPASGNAEILAGQTLVHVRADLDGCIVEPVYANYHAVKGQFVEVLG